MDGTFHLGMVVQSVPDDEDEFSALIVQAQQRQDEDGQVGVLSEGV